MPIVSLAVMQWSLRVKLTKFPLPLRRSTRRILVAQVLVMYRRWGLANMLNIMLKRVRRRVTSVLKLCNLMTVWPAWRQQVLTSQSRHKR